MIEKIQTSCDEIMTEKQKMIAGKYYYSSDQELHEDRLRAKKLCKVYNDLEPDDVEAREKILKTLFNADKACYIEPSFYCSYGYNIYYGDHFFLNHNCVILDAALVTIGNHVMMGPNVQLYTAHHPLNPRERNALKEIAYPIIIGDNVWIGGGAIICPGVTIGDNAVVGAGSVVTKDVPQNVVVAGNPARMIKEIEM